MPADFIVGCTPVWDGMRRSSRKYTRWRCGVTRGPRRAAEAQTGRDAGEGGWRRGGGQRALGGPPAIGRRRPAQEHPSDSSEHQPEHLYLCSLQS